MLAELQSMSPRLPNWLETAQTEGQEPEWEWQPTEMSEQQADEMVGELFPGIDEGFSVEGTDVSIATCIEEGYGIVKWPAWVDLDKATFEYFETSPDLYDASEGTIPVVATTIWLEDLIEAYQDNKEAIDSYIGGEYPQDPKAYTSGTQIADLAFTLNQYMGIFTHQSYAYRRVPLDQLKAELEVDDTLSFEE